MTALAIAHHAGFELHTLSFDYGQRHQREVEAALAVARHYNVQTQKMIEIDLREFDGSAVTDEFDVPHARSLEKMSQGIPFTYVPARNTILLSFALAYAEVTGANDIFLGINAIDYSGYPDWGLACGTCDSCLLRLNGFAEAGLRDPIGYIPQSH